MTHPSEFSGRYTRSLFYGLVIGAALLAVPAMAQDDDEKVEHEVAVTEAKEQIERPTLEAESEAPTFRAEQFLEEKGFQSLQRQDEAIVHLRDLIRATPESNPQRAEFLFNLSEIYWERSRYYDRTSVEKNDECYA
ncbi:MAG: hypothetical protein ACNA8W_18535, partial [Bradymonadaceae bacterium]